MRRVFIDSDFIDEDEVSSAKRTLYHILSDSGVQFNEDEPFNDVVGRAWHEPDKAWEVVKNSDEIYASTSLVPLCGYGTYTGSVVVMDVMMQKAIDEKIKGKSVYFLRQYKNIEWDGIDLKLLPKAFKNNKLYTLEYVDENYSQAFVEVDIKQVLTKNK